LHPWQWHERIATSFAADIARNDIIYLGQGQDSYLAQQSIRTFFNLSNPHKNYVKTALSILNMGFMRGLSPHSMVTTPLVNE
ncbi:IucA/IucC family protein, partial [Yersinia pestis]